MDLGAQLGVDDGPSFGRVDGAARCVYFECVTGVTGPQRAVVPAPPARTIRRPVAPVNMGDTPLPRVGTLWEVIM